MNNYDQIFHINHLSHRHYKSIKLKNKFQKIYFKLYIILVTSGGCGHMLKKPINIYAQVHFAWGIYSQEYTNEYETKFKINYNNKHFMDKYFKINDY